ncbi:Ger(x)C family spore germination protein [Lederbergia lenta]|uniref:Protein GerKC2 n=1 Tax=Lederbergia lenta TaxID=1467 RepID=A0A2X4VQK3_LEDLE|nr:Ger(x)C family spore germination protein [Lederbergia lenta]MCM3112558.1 Ger(x)C family spore germination protein [Lederbergia lenta]MEC2323594.1 Ger(x)C family spore germination protein [Lederbergia lenta]SQI52529.1 protein GerKC2 [Lederbergia lenta]
MKLLKVLLVSAVPIFLLTGCWGSSELEENAYAVVIGLDKAEDHMVEVTFQIANPQVGSTETGAAQSEPPSDIVTVTAPDILSAKELANSIVSRKLNLDHLRTIIIAEDFAKTKLAHHTIASSIIDPEMRRENNIIVSKEKASEFINKNNPKLETRPHKYYMFMQKRWRDTGFVPYSTLNRYFQRLSGELFLAIYATTEKDEIVKKNEDDYLAGQVPQKSGDPVQMIGSAVFKDGKMIGTLTGAETRISLFLRPKGLSHSVIQSYPDPINDQYRISVRMMKKGKTKVKIDTKTNPTEVKVTVPVALQVFSNPSLSNYTTNLKNQQRLKESIKDTLEKETIDFIKKTQDEFKSEPFLWYLEARQTFWTIDEYTQYNWPKKYSEAKIEVNFNVEIENLGEQLKPAVIKK